MLNKKLSWLVLPVFSLWLAACGGNNLEDCQNAADDDGDGLLDCDDDDCKNVSFCVALENCNTPGDEDGNGAADCDDSVCASLPQCAASCGDGNVNAGEQCDGANLNSTSCTTLGFGGGTLSCNGNCFFDTAQCTPGTIACGDGIVQGNEQCDNGINNGAPGNPCAANCTLVGQGGVCGDGIIDAGEDCDGTALNGESCTSLGFASGTLACAANCLFNTAQCTGGGIVCGNNIQEPGEQCDGNDLNGESCTSLGFASGTLACTTNGTCAFDQSGCVNGNENCTNGVDDDSDGLIDCDPNGPDVDCDCNNSCTTPTVITDPSTVQGDTTGHNQSRTGTCVGANAPDVAFQVTVATTGNLELILDSQADLGMYVRTVCNQNTEIGGNACADDNPGGQLETLIVPVTAGQTLFIIVDGFVNQQGVAAFGPFSLSVESVVSQCGNGQINAGEECDGAALNGQSCVSQGFTGGTLACAANCTFNTTQCAGGVEICTNGTDDDADNAIDCNDSGCQNACADACNAPTPISAGVTTGTTVGHATNRQGTCDTSQQNNAPDVGLSFTAATAGTLTAVLTTGFDAVLYARSTCGQQATELDCSDNGAANQTETVSFNVTAGQTVTLFVDGFNGASGNFSLNVSLQ